MATSSEFELEVAILEQKTADLFFIWFIVVVAVVQLAALHHLDPLQFWSLRWFVEVFWARQQPVQKRIGKINDIARYNLMGTKYS